ncbi:AMP-dependent synthetase [Hyphomicrobium nitrativorans NL23]|uniref:AMP-dependent synthetase n=1 Tax=Hyphomicrobium nitrativorans NL23 TaxID=1029756 RepID=V5SEE6_9HYPH|nr:long-chain fatty acid--CoA ligase [Hyphomicrobium nitrativorans]AHB48893.1 AMP-dependent synthetase [Hyphomicrobium nitrativorans NL23]
MVSTETARGAAAPHAYAWLRSYPKDVQWTMAAAPRPLFSLIETAAAEHPDRPCANFLGSSLTYREIADLVDRAAAGLQALGVIKGTKVGLFLPNSPTFIVYYFAVLKAGGVVVNYNPLYSLDELTFQVKDSETELMVTLDLKILFEKVERLLTDKVLKGAVVCSFPALLPATKAVLFKLFKSKELARPKASQARDVIRLEAEVLADPDTFTPVPIDPETDIAVLQYTGGTTGTPKGAMLTHANVYLNVEQIVRWAPALVQGQEKVLAVLPFFHVFAMTVVLNLGVRIAAEQILMPRFTLSDALDLITKHRPTLMPGVPTLFNAILNHPNIKSYDLTSLKFCISGGAALPLEIKERFEAVTRCALVEGYGLSETSPVVTCNPLDGPVKSGSIGLPLPGTIVSLRDLTDPTREVPQGERGEVCVAGPQVMKGYWNRPQDTQDQFVGEFVRTGDVGVMDKDGFFFIVDRIKDLIICSGYNVYPRRVEEALYEHAAVEEVIVVGIADKYRGEAPKAFVKLKDGEEATKAILMKHLEAKLSKIEMPADIEFRDTLPRTMIGKLSKKELKAEEVEKSKTKPGA